jgi:hypothetical protein
MKPIFFIVFLNFNILVNLGHFSSNFKFVMNQSPKWIDTKDHKLNRITIANQMLQTAPSCSKVRLSKYFQYHSITNLKLVKFLLTSSQYLLDDFNINSIISYKSEFTFWISLDNLSNCLSKWLNNSSLFWSVKLGLFKLVLISCILYTSSLIISILLDFLDTNSITLFWLSSLLIWLFNNSFTLFSNSLFLVITDSYYFLIFLVLSFVT